MTALGEFNKCGEEIESYLLLRSAPLAVKLLKTEADIPEGAIRPKKDLGCQIAMCQGVAKARRERVSIAMLKEDHRCYVPVIGYGLAEPPQVFLDGKTKYPRSIISEEGAKKWAKEWYRLEYGRCVGVVMAPLKTANFEPDVVVIYGNSAQLRHLLIAMQYKDGYTVTAKLEPMAGCICPVVPIILNGGAHVTVPDPGEYVRALAGEDEMIFSVSRDMLEDLMMGLRHAQETGRNYLTTNHMIKLDFPVPDLYRKMGGMMGLTFDD